VAKSLPPLHLLHLFEAAGRNLSFKKAGEELHLTPSAISHQIKSLEEHLDITLFRRITRGVELTSAGQQYLWVVQGVFKKLEMGTASLKRDFSSLALRISTVPSIASNIIIPRLKVFQSEFPGVELRIETGLKLVDLRYDEFDLAIRIGDGNWPGVVVEKLFDIDVTPVCSAAFAEKHQLHHIEQLSDVPLLHDAAMENGWAQWAKNFQLSKLESNSGLRLGSYDEVIQAARQSLGVALGGLPFEYAALKNGELVKPFDALSRFPHSCYAVYREYDQQRDEIKAFVRWFKLLGHLQPR